MENLAVSFQVVDARQTLYITGQDNVHSQLLSLWDKRLFDVARRHVLYVLDPRSAFHNNNSQLVSGSLLHEHYVSPFQSS